MADFADAAAIVSELDLIIMTDSAMAHLARALGKKVWVLLNSAPYWMWGDGRVDSPWYDSMKTTRQNEWNGWMTVFDKVATELLHFIEGEARLNNKKFI